MAEYRCPKHDLVFQTLTDQRKPGSLASDDKRFPAHPTDGHPDCPLCEKESAQPSASAKSSTTTNSTFRTLVKG